MAVLTQTASPGLPRNATQPQIIDQQNRMLSGALNCNADLTLESSASSTVLIDSRIGPGSCLLWMPTTAHASAEVGAGTIYVSARTKGSATIAHANNAQTDRTFRVAILGG